MWSWKFPARQKSFRGTGTGARRRTLGKGMHGGSIPGVPDGLFGSLPGLAPMLQKVDHVVEESVGRSLLLAGQLGVGGNQIHHPSVVRGYGDEGPVPEAARG